MSDLHNLTQFQCIQSPYNLLTRDIEYELLPFCVMEGIGVCVYNPLAGGLLTGKHELNKPPAEGRFTHEYLGAVYRDRYWSATNFAAIAQLKQIAERHNRNLAQFSLAWALSNKAITSVICGASSIKQLQDNLGATELELSEEELTACDDVWRQLRPPRFPYGK